MVLFVPVCNSLLHPFTGSSPEYVKDSEEDETPLWTYEAKYKQGNKLFMTRIPPESTMEDLCTTSIVRGTLGEAPSHTAV